MQETDCRDYAEHHGLTVATVLSDDISGTVLDRPGLNQARDMAEAGQIDAIIIWTADRLARKHVYIALLEEEFTQAGVEVHYADAGKVEDDDPEAQLAGGMKGIFAEYERSRIRKRLMRGRREKVEKKQQIVGAGADAPYGYRYEGMKADKRLVICDDEAQIVRDIFTWYIGGTPIMHIQDKLNALRVPPPSTGRKVQTNNLGWSRATLYKILHSHTYAGIAYFYRKKDGRMVKDRDKWIGVPVPAIVDQQTFEAAQARLAIGRQMSQRRCQHDYLLRCRITCACGYSCGGLGGSRKISYYECLSRRERGRKCAHLYYRSHDVDSTVWRWIETVVLDQDNLRTGLAKRQETVQDEHTQLDAQRASYHQQRATIEQETTKLIQLFTSGIFTLEQIAHEKQRLDVALKAVDDEIVTVDQRIAGLGLSEDEVDELTTFAASVKRKLADLSFASKRRVVDLLDTRVELKTIDGVKYADVTCHLTLNSETLPIVSISCSKDRHNTIRLVVFSARLIIASALHALVEESASPPR
jgi:site-specific DNA recombinase